MFREWLLVSIAIVHFMWCDSSAIKNFSSGPLSVGSNESDDTNKITTTTSQFPSDEDYVADHEINDTFHELLLGPLNDSYSWYQYSTEIGNQQLSDQHYSSRAVMWRTKYWSLHGENIGLKKKYNTLSSQFYWFVEEWNCADFFRDFITHVENSFLAIENPKNYEKIFNNNFEKENPTFALKFINLRFNGHRRLVVYEALKQSGIKIINRNDCTFEFMTNEEYTGPVPKNIMNCAATERSNLNLCEKWTFFLYAVKTSPDSRNPELEMWSNVIDGFEAIAKQPYPLLVQRIFHARYHSNQFHHIRKHNYSFDWTMKLHNKALDQNQQVYCLYKFLLGWQWNQNTHWISTTEIWTPPASYQDKLNGRPPTTPTTTDNSKKIELYRKYFITPNM